MIRPLALIHEFVDFVPRDLKEGVVYVSIQYATVIHKCCCGCGRQVVTPLAPSQWTLSYDGRTISLHPSIGNWNFPCKSHYWIRGNQVLWAKRWSEAEIVAGQHRDAKAIRDEFVDRQSSSKETTAKGRPATQNPSKGIFARLKDIFGK